MEMRSLKLKKIPPEMYVSEDWEIEFKRIPSGKWGYFRNGLLLDTDRYRTDLAERNHFTLD